MELTTVQYYCTTICILVLLSLLVLIIKEAMKTNATENCSGCKRLQKLEQEIASLKKENPLLVDLDNVVDKVDALIKEIKK